MGLGHARGTEVSGFLGKQCSACSVCRTFKSNAAKFGSICWEPVAAAREGPEIYTPSISTTYLLMLAHLLLLQTCSTHLQRVFICCEPGKGTGLSTGG